MIPAGFRRRISSRGIEKGWISQYTFSSRTRRAMSWVYWEPKSRTTIMGGPSRDGAPARPSRGRGFVGTGSGFPRSRPGVNGGSSGVR